MAKHPDIEPALLRQLLRYDPDTGKLYWRTRPSKLFKRDRDAIAWNKSHAGQEAFTYLASTGYYFGTICGTRLAAHRVCYAWQHGMWPDNDIDHINGVRSDNRILNLRDVPRLLNTRNAKRYSINQSSVSGVVLRPSGYWKAEIGVGSSTKFIGQFKTKEEAIAARRVAALALGYSPRHGSHT